MSQSTLGECKADYLELQEKVDVLTAALKISVEVLRDKVVPVMEQENKSGNFETPPEVLREYIQITRNIRDMMFKRLDTHILTIEHLADKILCRIAALEKNRKTAVKRAIVKEHDDTKVATDIVDALNKLSPAERLKMRELLG